MNEMTQRHPFVVEGARWMIGAVGILGSFLLVSSHFATNVHVDREDELLNGRISQSEHLLNGRIHQTETKVAEAIDRQQVNALDRHITQLYNQVHDIEDRISSGRTYEGDARRKKELLLQIDRAKQDQILIQKRLAGES